MNLVWCRVSYVFKVSISLQFYFLNFHLLALFPFIFHPWCPPPLLLLFLFPHCVQYLCEPHLCLSAAVL